MPRCVCVCVCVCVSLCVKNDDGRGKGGEGWGWGERDNEGEKPNGEKSEPSNPWPLSIIHMDDRSSDFPVSLAESFHVMGSRLFAFCK